MIFKCPHCHEKVDKELQTTCAACHRQMTRHCPYCSENISVLATTCKYCGESVQPAESAGGPVIAGKSSEATTTPSSPPAPHRSSDIEFVEDTRYCAWEDRARKGMFGRWYSTWFKSQFSPGTFWSQMPTDRGHLKPHQFTWFMTAQFALFAAPILAFLAVIGAATGDLHPNVLLAGGVVYAALFPALFVVTTVTNYVRAIVAHVLLKILGAKGTFQGTLRIMAYSCGAALWVLPPLPLIFGLIGDYHAYRNVHALSKGRALFAAFFPMLFAGALAAGLILFGLCHAASSPACVRAC